VCVSFLKRETHVYVFLWKEESCVCLSLKGRLMCVSFFERETHVSCLFLKGRVMFVSFFKRESQVCVFL